VGAVLLIRMEYFWPDDKDAPACAMCLSYATSWLCSHRGKREAGIISPSSPGVFDLISPAKAR
jgi:hypothetical protein